VPDVSAQYAASASLPRARAQFLAMPAVLAVSIAVFSAANAQFLSPRNLSMLMVEWSVTATLAIGMLLVILPGQIDLSAGSGVGLLGGLAAVLMFRHDWPAGMALAAAVVAGTSLWGIMGLAIVKLKIQAFIITLGGLLAFKGCFWLIIRSSTVPVSSGDSNVISLLTTWHAPPVFGLALLGVAVVGLAWAKIGDRRARAAAGLPVESVELSVLKLVVMGQSLLLAVLVCNRYRGIPLSLLILSGLALAAHFLIRHTPLGRQLYAIGGNAEAAYACGIPIDQTVTIAFALMGAIVAITGCMQTAYAGASTPSVGELLELDAIAACVIGGASLRGGRGSVLGTLCGSLVMATLLNGMTLLAVGPELKLIVRGAVLVLAVLMDVRLRRE
jgi:D-xylose transport system permease protein